MRVIQSGGARAIDVGEPPPGMVPFTGIDDPREVRIEDAGGRESDFTLDHNGFALVRAPSRVHNFYSPGEVECVCYPYVERILRDTLGASRQAGAPLVLFFGTTAG